MKYRACALALVALWLSACGSDVETTPGIPATPRIEVVSPTPGFTSEEPVVRLSGTVNAPGTLASLTVTVNGGAALPVEVTSVGSSGSFSVELTLPEGDNTVRMEAVDQVGGKGTQKVTVRYAPESEPPQVRVVSPDEGLAVSVRRVRVEAVATDNKGVVSVSYSLNGGQEQSLAVPTDAAGTLAFEVTPKPGANAVKLTARDARGNAGEATVSFHFGGLGTAGGLHSGTLRDGRVYTWGRNNRGQLGLGADVTADQKQPQVVPGLEAVTSIAFNQNFATALTADGSVWTWGENSDSQLGQGAAPVEGETRALDITPRYAATRVPGISGAVAVAPGFRHTLVLLEDGTVRAFGNNANGQLGDGTVVAKDYPVVVRGLTDVVKVLGGSMHSAALKRDGTVWVWGRNDYGNLGNGVADGDSHPLPSQVPGVTDVVDIANGRDHLLAVHTDGTVSAWGLDVSGQLGLGFISPGTESATPVKVKNVTQARAVFANGNYSFARLADGSLMAWGQNFNGQLGLGVSEQTHPEPTASSAQVAPLSSMGMGATHVIAVRKDGSVFAWGWNLNGSLGPDAVIDRWSYTDPIPVTLP
ncbi:Ig-like domain-containing protein [Myxococcus sp. K15C18031901]|uniref:RCC1 domain-containing protein n=1 Tax=Myxococcus dinghuensis TaxID=2906761 RepID=UPI0020A6F76E|nr:Ig-like domain-containing protein [Myxococcus dinghuensis]MCP3102291.1 Ig-like domain-containing protein [Myxococcus dinghuensis]